MTTTCPIVDDVDEFVNDFAQAVHSMEDAEGVKNWFHQLSARMLEAARETDRAGLVALREGAREWAVAQIGSHFLCPPKGGREAAARRSETLARLLVDEPTGADQATIGFERFLFGSTLVSALRTRRVFARRELYYRARLHDGVTPFAVMGLGNGPKSEGLRFLLKERDAADRIEVTLVDSNLQTLERSMRSAARGNVAESLHCIHGEPARFAMAGHERDRADQDFISALVGLDDLPDPLLLELLEYAFGRLRPGGELLLAFFHAEVAPVDRLAMEWWLGWSPMIRSTASIATLLHRTSIPSCGQMVGMERGPNYYVVVQKSA